MASSYYEYQKMADNEGLAIGLALGLGFPLTTALIVLAVIYSYRSFPNREGPRYPGDAGADQEASDPGGLCMENGTKVSK
ncbi:hypothetical protein N7491_008032 [Penicillium cf. griseofulvum]|uniref:Uncharacterized protein n=1 Tax=Penicillium cf. griseofulvum TaxID=2972120 RepID=A0A9W9J5B6_9EURO|nr:hypothetical protein N7472_008941 [Penicillium cf. griseofulvum]KAJ5427590.1 hypothetical protein N7491_008032 [Penicillium cf. griseofulvum]KAJ5431787.1 hypothetical protein N7445_008285 [Penicillium cf. griseofulvum]